MFKQQVRNKKVIKQQAHPNFVELKMLHLFMNDCFIFKYQL